MHQQPQENIDVTIGDTRLELGVIGCGAHCMHSHLSKIGAADNAVLAGVFDPSKQSVAELAHYSLSPSAIFATEEELILSSAKAVLIMSPDDFHADSLLRAVRAGKHVFVEKPLATDSRQLGVAVEALSRAREQGQIVSSCHPRRFDPPFLWLKENLAGLVAELGPVSHFEFDFSYHKPSKQWKHERGLLLDHINHEIDLVHWYFGHQPFSAWKLADSPHHYHAVGIRDDGIHFSFNGSRQLESSVYREFVKVRFQRGTLALDTNFGEVSIHNHDAETRSSHHIQGIDYDRRFRLVNQNFIHAVQGIAENYLTLQDLYVNTATGVHLTEQDQWRYDGKDV